MGAAGSGNAKTYIEDVFSTWLYTGNGSTQTITNGIDLSGKGGLVWVKGRSGATGHRLVDTSRGAQNSLQTNSTAAQVYERDGISDFGSSGFSLGTFLGSDNNYNSSGSTYTSWTFRKAAKFFDVVTYTGTGSNQNISHNLGAIPGFVIVKRLNTTGNWSCWHRSLASSAYILLNTTGAAVNAGGSYVRSVTNTTYQVFGDFTDEGAAGSTYVAYLFAHDAGGFGDSGNESVVSCGSYTGNGSTTGPTVSLGWEPQWLLIKRTDAAGENWFLVDSMRGLTVAGSDDEYLLANSSNAAFSTSFIAPLATGFQLNSTSGAFNASGGNYIYIAIRRGPMKTPTDATKVFGLNARTGTGVNATVTGGQVDDAVLIKNRGSAVGDLFAARLTGTGYLETSSTAAEIAAGTTILQANPWDVMDGVKVGTTSTITNASANTFINYAFRRAPGFFDAVAYTGTNTSSTPPLTLTHNLGVTPEFIITKLRSTNFEWFCWHKDLSGATGYIQLQSNAAKLSSTTLWGNTLPTATQFTVGSGLNSTNTGIAYLFATCPGVSKVGSYTGNGGTQTIDCGFTNGARFVLIKRTDAAGDWIVGDTARGITINNDPFLMLNRTDAEITSQWIQPISSGFRVVIDGFAQANTTGGSYIYLAIA